MTLPDSHLLSVLAEAGADDATIAAAGAVIASGGSWAPGNEADDWLLRTAGGALVLTVWAGKDADYRAEPALLEAGQ